MHFKSLTLFLVISFMFTACAKQEYITQHAAFILFKTPSFKYADMGFIYENDTALKAEIYGSGQPVMSLEISQTAICMSSLKCLGKHAFNVRVLHAGYPEDTIENILRGRAIFARAGMKKNRNGFTQTLTKKNQYAIRYTVLNTHIHFHDTINNILIKVEKH